MPSVHSNLRRRYPFLTPGFYPDDDKMPPLRRDDNDDVLRDLLTRRRVTQPMTETEALPPLQRSAVPMEADDAIPALRRTPPVDALGIPTAVEAFDAPEPIRRRNGRPYQPYFGHADPADRTTAYRRELESYQPQRESKKHILARTALAFIGGGIPAAAYTAGEGLLNRRGLDQRWQQDELARADDQMGRLRLDRRAGLQDDYLQSQIDENKAQAAALAQPKPRNLQLGSAALPDGRTVQMERDQPGWKVSTTADGQPIVTKPAPSSKPKVVVNVPNIGPIEVTPEAALGYYGTSENRNFQREQNAQDADFTNAQIEANIKSTEQQLAKVSEALTNTSEQIATATYKDGGADYGSNPRYNDLKNEQQQLQRELRDWQAKRKPPTLTRGGKDPQVQSYADKFFGGSYERAETAIKRQRGQ